MPSSETYARWLALFRIYAGAFWLLHGIPKFTQSADFLPPNGFMPQLIQKAIGSSTGFYHDFLANTVLPNVGLFAELTRYGEVLVGISLLLGLLSRLGGLGGIFLALNYALANNDFATSQGFAGLDFVAIVLSFFNVVLPTGARLGFGVLFVRPRRRAVAS